MAGWLVLEVSKAAARSKVCPPIPSPTDDGGVALKCPTEIAISDRRENELSNLGFLPLLHCKDTDWAVFMGAQSCQKPKKYFDADANSNASPLDEVQLHDVCVTVRSLPQGDGPRQNRHVQWSWLASAAG